MGPWEQTVALLAAASCGSPVRFYFRAVFGCVRALQVVHPFTGVDNRDVSMFVTVVCFFLKKVH
jgi:hypothetical protein